MGVLKTDSQPVWNMFCPTGSGGGRDPTCGLGGKSGGGSAKAEPVGGMASRSGRKLARQMGRADKAAKAKASAGKSLQQKLEEDDAAKKAIKDKRTEAVKRTAKEHGISEKDAKKYLRDSPGMAVGP